MQEVFEGGAGVLTEVGLESDMLRQCPSSVISGCMV